ncbi:hypothetical protein [Rhodococcus opacus]|uniref:Uncharacterized protein n=1 Tax=Rhodococcus pseudokoreensis TaxID=2811421 RepID=A0A974VYU9_9NOCA|nr:hypothetical protein [Rhodococcus opacus]QSE87228.1 hypothetical protein JWS13_00560 [Rhodococcus pseudokoreensis]
MTAVEAALKRKFGRALDSSAIKILAECISDGRHHRVFADCAADEAETLAASRLMHVGQDGARGRSHTT